MKEEKPKRANTRAASNSADLWMNLTWSCIESKVNKLQSRIAKAVKQGRFNLAKKLQYLLVNSFYAKLLAIKRISQNKGKNTAGIDGVLWNSPSKKYNGELSLESKGYKASPLIYYNDDFIVYHPISDKRFNYKLGHMHEILKSDACKHLSDEEINTFIAENISMMDILNNLEVLKLEQMYSYIPTYLDTVAKEGISVLDALIHLTDKEIIHKNEMASKIQVSVAGFPFVKRVDEYDYYFQPSVKKPQIMDLCTLRFLEKKENILFYGTPGVGKTHLATAIGIEAASKRQLTYFITCHDLIQNLRKAYHENRLETRLKHYSKYKVLIIDEIGYLPVDQLGANLFFQLITKRYENNSTIITTNQPFSKWGEGFSDMTLANVILDRLLHHSHIIKIIGPSYRTKDVLDHVQDGKNKTIYKPS